MKKFHCDKSFKYLSLLFSNEPQYCCVDENYFYVTFYSAFVFKLLFLNFVLDGIGCYFAGDSRGRSNVVLNRKPRKAGVLELGTPVKICIQHFAAGT